MDIRSALSEEAPYGTHLAECARGMAESKGSVWSLTIALLTGMLISYQRVHAHCLAGTEHVGRRVKRIKIFKHLKRKCDLSVTGKITIVDVMTNQEVRAYIMDSTQCYNRNGERIECEQL